MNAMGVTRTGFTPQLIDIDEPTPAAHEVVVDVTAAPVDGRSFAGTVAAVGTDVDYINVGMYVSGVTASRAFGQPGRFSEKVAVPVELIAPIPDGMDPAQAAVVGLAGITAVSALDALGVTHLGNMVIHGPVRGVGGFALQLAKARGAVVAVVTHRGDVDLARRLGADAVVTDDTDAARAMQKVRFLLDGRVDTVIHLAGDPSLAAGIVRTGGRITSVAETDMRPTRSDIEYRPTVVSPSGHTLADLLFKVASRRLAQISVL
ncbi:MAG: hypothetical protein QOH60_4277 [Mycobacterium sp.]|nr:hypothetical protein [Mycobacterium sp.]